MIAAWMHRLAGKPNTDRKRFKRCEPLFGKYAFTPVSTCPHGVRISKGWVCMICQGVSPDMQRGLDRLDAIPTVEPEERITDEIALLQAILDDPARRIPPHQRRAIGRRLEELDEELSEWIPTRYRPDPARKGGK